MTSITQDMRFRLAVIKYADKYGVSKAAARYKTNRQYIYRWKRRYDGTWDSLRDRSRRPHHHPNQHTEVEIKLINNIRRRNPNDGLVIFWVKLRQHGYKRSITGLYRFLCKQNLMAVKPKNPKYKPKPYEQMSYPGQRIQIDVKFVPSSCLVNEAKGQKFYQYTAIDEYSRWRYVEAFKEHSTYSSMQFLEHLVKAFPMPIECIQTDNGQEFTKRLSPGNKVKTPTIFEVRLKQLGIRHKLIRPFTPRHNGKVERSHRKDNERFYATHTFYSFEDFSKQLTTYNKRDYNRFPMRPLGWKSPQTVLYDFVKYGVTYV
ncbi:IS481 family transposase [Defluviitalea saccharophila]|uniref:IS481 family transposase n=1 Tax=Defluviitalea saccharophila TaxID=879970 RepID=A0ABZ2Y4A2_9FIRM